MTHSIEHTENEHIISCQLGRMGDTAYARFVLRFEDNAIFLDASETKWTQTGRQQNHSVIYNLDIGQLRALHETTGKMLQWIDAHK